MKIMIFAANWYNRGDESAIRAMIDEFRLTYPNAQFKIQFGAIPVEHVPYNDMEIISRMSNVQRRFPVRRIMYKISIATGGRFNIMPATRLHTKIENRKALEKFIETVKWCDLAVYAPGGPCIGDLYRTYTLLDCIDIIRYYKKPYVFYAPSMGPFRQYKSRIAQILKDADIVAFRESISAGYAKELVPDLNAVVTLDSAFQHPVEEKIYSAQLKEYTELNEFLKLNKRNVGITITDLMWHANHRSGETAMRIRTAFSEFIKYLRNNGYGVVFIPQLFGRSDDKTYMSSYAGEGCFVVDDVHDCYFQQYLISKLYAVVGMRYHSNIFSAKMGTPFVSVAYEQKMRGFMEKTELVDYCFNIEELSAENLTGYFEKLVRNHDTYKKKLADLRKWCESESYKTTQMVVDLIEEKGLNS